MERYILSISIPTYNRSHELYELLQTLLSIDSDRLEIVVTDNVSTDNTIEMLSGIRDDRVKVFENDTSIPGYYNMITGLFNATGKYVMHCNDRDVLFLDKLKKVIDFLECEEYSFVQTSRGYLEPSYDVQVYAKGFDSLYNHNFSSHPTGMIFNRELMGKYLRKECYRQYVDDTFTYCFLMRELLVYEKSAKYDVGCWNERHSSIKFKLKSGSVYKGGLYFEPDRISVFMKSVIKHLICNEYFCFSTEEKRQLVEKIVIYFKNQLMYKKLCYADKRECAHYGIKKRIIHISEMKRIYENYIVDCNETINNLGISNIIGDNWEKIKKKIMDDLWKDYVKTSKLIISKNIKRIIDRNYPY